MAALICLLLVPLVFLIPEKRRAAQPSALPNPEGVTRRQSERAQTLATLRSAAASPGLWVLVVYIFYLIVTPGTVTAQVYYETDVLHLSKHFIGSLGRWTATGVLAATFIYAAASRWLSARTLVWGAWPMDCAAYLLLQNIHNAPSAEIVSFLVALAGVLYSLCLYSLAGRACPVGAEGVVYGLVLSAIALGNTLGDKLGGTLYDAFGPLHHHSVAHGWNLHALVRLRLHGAGRCFHSVSAGLGEKRRAARHCAGVTYPGAPSIKPQRPPLPKREGQE